jgi:NADH dehydrogenase/NADH:ubiquinone oxidoreductase subunit G
MRNKELNRPGKFTSTLAVLLAALLLMAAPLQTSYAQGPQASASASADELTRLKVAYSEALDRIETDKIKLEAADAYVKRLEEEKDVSERALATAKEEREALYRLQKLHEEEATRLRNAIAEKEKEAISLKETIVAQDKVITKQNGKIKFLKKVAKVAFVVGLGVGVGVGIKVGGR